MKSYEDKINWLFSQFPSYQKVGKVAYKPGIETMEAFDAALGHPHRRFRSIHVAGTNGKGSTSHMLAAGLAACGLKVGLYTSPHLVDFRERMKIVEGDGFRMVPKEFVESFIDRWQGFFEEHKPSFFEITTGMAFAFFADEKVDVAVIETGLGGRLDSTNVITPILSIITNIGLEHCEHLGYTLAAIAGEKAGIIKPGVPVVAGSRDPETAPVFTACADACGAPLRFADSDAPLSGRRIAALARRLDLRGDYQKANLATALTALDCLFGTLPPQALEALPAAGHSLDFRGRWDLVARQPDILCDIGHNPPALAENLRQLRRLMGSGQYRNLTMVLGMMADKDVSGLRRRIPRGTRLVLTAASTPRSLTARQLQERMLASGIPAAKDALLADSVAQALQEAMKNAAPGSLIYVGGSAYVVSDAFRALGVHTGPGD